MNKRKISNCGNYRNFEIVTPTIQKTQNKLEINMRYIYNKIQMPYKLKLNKNKVT